MPINDDFLGSITNALINRVNEPGRLDDVVVQVREITQGLGKSAQAINKIHTQISGTFKEAARQAKQYRSSHLPEGAGLSAQESTNIFNKIIEPLQAELRELKRERLKSGAAYSKQFTAERAFEQQIKGQFARLQNKLERRAERVGSSAGQPPETVGFRNQRIKTSSVYFNRAWTEIARGPELRAQYPGAAVHGGLPVAKVRVESKKSEQTREQQIFNLVRQQAKDQRKDLYRIVAESSRQDWPGPAVTGKNFWDLGYRQVRTPALDVLAKEQNDIFVRWAIHKVTGGITARAMHPARSTDYGIKRGSGPSAEITPGYLGPARITIGDRIDVLNRFLRNTKVAVTDPIAARNLLSEYVQGSLQQEHKQRRAGRVQRPNENIRSGEDLSFAVMTAVNTRAFNEEFLGGDVSNAERREMQKQAAYASDPSRLRKMATIDTMLKQPGARPPKKSVYVAGPMRGLPELNFPAFDAAEVSWRKRGWGVVNPAQMDREHGYIPTKKQTVFKDLSIEQAMSRDLPAVAGTHAIALLKGWEKSQGAKMELQHAIERRKEIYDAETGKRLKLKDVRAGLGADVLSKAISGRLSVGALRGEATTIFRPAEIAAFIGKYKGKPTGERNVIEMAAQMANCVGMTGSGYFDLTNIMLKSQDAGRRVQAAKKAESQCAAAEQLKESMRGGAGGGAAYEGGAARRILRESGFFGSEKGSISGGIFDPKWVAEGLGKAWRRARGASAGTRAGQAQTERILSYEERARMRIPEAADLRGQVRRDALESKLRRLAEVVVETTKAFEHYRDVVAPRRVQEAQARYAERDAAITRGLAGTTASLDAQVQRVEARRARASTTAVRRKSDIGSTFEERVQSLGFSELDAQFTLDLAQERRVRRMADLARVETKSGGRKYSAETIKQMVAPITQRPGMRYAKAAYMHEVAKLGVVPGAGSESQIQALRQGFAAQYAIARYGTGEEVRVTREKYAKKVESILGGRTAGQKVALAKERTEEDRAAKEQELDQQIASINKRRQSEEEKATRLRAVAKEKQGTVEGKIADELAKRTERNTAKLAVADRKAHEARVKYLKQEDVIVGKGGGGRGAGAGARAGGWFSEGASRSGYGFGLSASMMVGASTALNHLIKDIAIYSAKTEVMEVSTLQMAKVAGLNTDEVKAQAEAIKGLNVTTQAAHQTLQRFMMMQLDLASATGHVRVAQDLAAISGQDAMQTIERLTIAIVTGYTRNLHMLGLQVTAIGAIREAKLERRIAGKKGEPTEMEKRQTMVDQIAREGAKVYGTYERKMLFAGGQYLYLSKEIQETSNVLGREFLPVFGRVMANMSGGLRYVQAHGREFASLTSVLASLSQTAGALGSVAFFRWMMGAAGPMPVWAKLGAAAVGVGAYAVLNQSKTDAMAKTAVEQIDALKERTVELRKVRQDLVDIGKKEGPSASLDKAFEINRLQLESAAKQQQDIQEDLVGILASQYNKDLDNQKEYFKEKKSLVDSFMQGVIPMVRRREAGEKGFLGMTYDPIGIFGGGFEHRKVKVPSAPGAKITEQDVLRRSEELRKESERQTLIGPTMVNRARREASILMSIAQSADEALEKYAEKFDESTGAAFVKARKMMGAPREKVLIDAEVEKARLDKYFVDLDAAQKGAARFDPFAIEKYDEFIKLASKGEGRAAGLARIEARQKDKKKIFGMIDWGKDIDLDKIKVQTDLQIAQIEEQTQVERILAGVVKGNYASEIAGIGAVNKLKKENLELTKKALPAAVDQHKITEAQIKADDEQAKIKLDERRKIAAEELARDREQYGAEQAARDLMMRPGLSGQDAIERAYMARRAGAAKLPDDEKRKSLQRFGQEEKEDIRQFRKDMQRQAAESRIAEYEDQQQLAMDIDRITSSRGRSEKERNLDEIRRATELQRRIAQKRYSEELGLGPQKGAAAYELFKDDLDKKKQQALDQAARGEASGVLKELKQREEDAATRLHDYYQQQVAGHRMIAELSATNIADERAAAYDAYRERLKYIGDEAAARRKTSEAKESIERRQRQETHEAEMEYLQILLQQRKQQIEGVRNVAGGLFDILAQRSGDRGRQLRDYGVGLVKGVGRTVAQNVAVEVLKGSVGKIGGVIGGQTKIDPATGKEVPTTLGRILAGTPLGKSATDKQIAAQKELVHATMANIKSEETLTEAIDNLRKAVEQYQGLTGGSIPSVTSTIGSSVTSPAEDTQKIIDWINGGTAGGQFSPFGTVLGSGGAVGQLPVNWDGVPIGGGKMIKNGAIVNAPKSASGLQQLFGGLSGGALGKYNLFDVLSGKSSIRTGAGSATALTGTERLGAILGAGTTVAAGAYQAYTGFSKGGAKGIVGGIGGVLTAASVIPGPQQPFMMAGAAIAGFLGSILGDSRESRGIDIQNYLSALKFIAPTQLSREMGTSGFLTSTAAHGGLSRESGIPAFPIDYTQTQYGTTPRKVWSDPRVPEYYEIPGRMQYDNLQNRAGPTYIINIPISAMDSQDVLRRSSYIAAAVKKEIQGGSDLSVALQQSLFGSGMS